MYKETTVPLKNVTLYSSGVAYYEHEGEASGAARIDLSFTPEQINDVLKSLIVSDTAAKNLAVEYQSEDALRKILESLSVNLNEASDLADILYAQRGAEIEVVAGEKTAEKIVGKILTVDRREREAGGDTLSLFASDGVHVVPFSAIRSFRFTSLFVRFEKKSFDSHRCCGKARRPPRIRYGVSRVEADVPHRRGRGDFRISSVGYRRQFDRHRLECGALDADDGASRRI